MMLVAFVTIGCDADSEPAPSTNLILDNAHESPRIVALLPFAADQLIEMGAPPVAVPQLRDGVPKAWTGITSIALDHSAGPNLEQLIAARPDVIVSSSTYAQFLPAIAEATNANVVIMDVDSVEDALKSIESLGSIARVPEQAAALVGSIGSTDDTVPSESPVRTLAVFGTPHSFYAFLPESYMGDLVSRSGGTLIPDSMESHKVFRGLAPLSMEVVIDQDPELLLVVFHGSEESARKLLDNDPLWSRLTAVKNGSIAFLEDDLYAMRPGSEIRRAQEGIETIMREAMARRP